VFIGEIIGLTASFAAACSVPAPARVLAPRSRDHASLPTANPLSLVQSGSGDQNKNPTFVGF